MPVDAAATGRAITVAVQAGRGGGSAVHVGKGVFLTAAHVIGAEKSVTLIQGSRQWMATLVSADFDADLALVRADKDVDLPTAPWASALRPGTSVLAIGFPAPLDVSTPTITNGIVSGTRDIDGVTYLQIDAAVNPGNSGGPILTQEGEIAGIVVFRAKQTEGLNFAIPADRARTYVEQPISRGAPVTATPVPTPTPTPRPTLDPNRVAVRDFVVLDRCLDSLQQAEIDKWNSYASRGPRSDAADAYNFEEQLIERLNSLPRSPVTRQVQDLLIEAEGTELDGIRDSLRYFDSNFRDLAAFDRSNAEIKLADTQRRHAEDALQDLQTKFDASPFVALLSSIPGAPTWPPEPTCQR